MAEGLEQAGSCKGLIKRLELRAGKLAHAVPRGTWPSNGLRLPDETLYHFHEPQDETEANAWLLNFLRRYNGMQHRSEPHARLEDWLLHLPPEGLREMCSWERFCAFAREPERRKVGPDARVTVAGVGYEVEPDLAGETVVVWFGLYDDQLYVEHGEHRYGPYRSIAGPIPLHRYRRFKKTRTQERADRIEILADHLALPRTALTAEPALVATFAGGAPPTQAFVDPDPFHQLTFAPPSMPNARSPMTSDGRWPNCRPTG